MSNAKRSYTLKEVLEMPDDTRVTRANQLDGHYLVSELNTYKVFAKEIVLASWHVVEPKPHPVTFETDVVGSSTTTHGRFDEHWYKSLAPFSGKRVKVTVELADEN